MTAADVRAIVEDVLPQVALPGDDDAELALDSLALVALSGELEARFDVRIRARDLTRAHFGSVAAIARLVAALEAAR